MAAQYIDPMLRCWTRWSLPLRTDGPQQCALCLSWSGQPLCAACQDRFAAQAPRCRTCALRLPAANAPCPHCLRHALPFAACVCAGDYGFPWDRLISRLKFQGEVTEAAPLAAALAAAVQASGAAAAQLLVPVPLGAGRLAERGLNQSWEIARRLARRLKLAAEPGALLRLRDTPHQVGMTRHERMHNLRGALCVEPSVRRRMEGRDIALVDDVMTTGATAAACADVLLAAGARSVQAWVVARTAAPDG